MILPTISLSFKHIKTKKRKKKSQGHTCGQFWHCWYTVDFIIYHLLWQQVQPTFLVVNNLNVQQYQNDKAAVTPTMIDTLYTY